MVLQAPIIYARPDQYQMTSGYQARRIDGATYHQMAYAYLYYCPHIGVGYRASRCRWCRTYQQLFKLDLQCIKRVKKHRLIRKIDTVSTRWR